MALTVTLCAALLALALLTPPSGGEMFTALVDMERALYTEEEVAQDLHNYVNIEQARLDKLRKIADDLSAHSTEALKDTHSFLANPVNAYLMVKRFTTDWQKVEDLISYNSSNEFLTSIMSKTQFFPSQEDLEGVASALLRLQDTYALPTSKLAKGEIQGVKYSPQLTAEDAFELGRLAYLSNDHYHTILWMQEARSILVTEGAEGTISEAELLDYLSFSVYQQGNTKQAVNLTQKWLSIEPEHDRAQNNLRYYEQIVASEEGGKGDQGDVATASPSDGVIRNERPLDDYRSGEEYQLYEALCRGEETHKYPKHHLRCQYKRHHPLYYIRPLHEETVYLDPWIVVYHDLLSDNEISKIKEIATPRLQRATVQNPQTGVLETAYYRVSKSAWLRDEEHKLIASTSGKVRALSNLTLDTAEELQVVNYGIGGHYEPHFDFARKREVETFDYWRGNRVATAIFYMSDVEAGGATVFPSIGVKLWPTKGSCAFWYNLKKNGEGDYQTRHAACPVLTGSKWVCNKWIHERGQEFMRPCDLNPAA